MLPYYIILGDLSFRPNGLAELDKLEEEGIPATPERERRSIFPGGGETTESGPTATVREIHLRARGRPSNGLIGSALCG